MSRPQRDERGDSGVETQLNRLPFSATSFEHIGVFEQSQYSSHLEIRAYQNRRMYKLENFSVLSS